MNMDKELVNRALYAAGLELLQDDDKENQSATYKLCLGYYLSTFLEALSEVPWTGAKRRKRLLKTRRPVFNAANYQFIYDLPYDCARPIELLNKEMFVIEGNCLFTDIDNAELLYVTNGKVLKDVKFYVSPRVGEVPDLFLSTGNFEEFDIPIDAVIYAGRPEDIIWHGIQTDENGVEIAGANTPEGWNAEVPLPFPENQDKEEDYPEYRPPEYEPKFYEYIEKMLAAKFATKNTTQPQLHNTLIQEAFLIKQEAINASKSISQAKQQPKKWWTEEMGG